MTPSPLLALGVTLRARHDEATQAQVARLAGRLGIAAVWLPLGPDDPWPDAGRLRKLADAARPARVGLVVERVPSGRAPSDVLLELPPAAPALGVDDWRARVHVRRYDAAAAGAVVRSAERAVTLDVLRDFSARRAHEGAAAPVLTAVVPVSVGRTRGEAVARAARDPELTGACDPAVAGLFGTLEEAQQQVLDLAAAGAEALRVVLADERDVADLLAQVRSLVVGPAAVLHARQLR